jgi:DNA-dependent RNA polymerase auxiliary subunit epsilon
MRCRQSLVSLMTGLPRRKTTSDLKLRSESQHKARRKRSHSHLTEATYALVGPLST